MKNIIKTPQDKRELEGMLSMMKSLYCYEQLRPDSRYLREYKEYFTEQIFALIYITEETRLKQTYKIEKNTYKYVEGCTYNSLTHIN